MLAAVLKGVQRGPTSFRKDQTWVRMNRTAVRTSQTWVWTSQTAFWKAADQVWTIETWVRMSQTWVWKDQTWVWMNQTAVRTSQTWVWILGTAVRRFRPSPTSLYILETWWLQCLERPCTALSSLGRRKRRWQKLATVAGASRPPAGDRNLTDRRAGAPAQRGRDGLGGPAARAAGWPPRPAAARRSAGRAR